MNFKQKYIKYKNKYLNLKKKLLGGSNDNTDDNEAQINGMLYQGPFKYTITYYSENYVENLDSSNYIKITDEIDKILFVHKDDECKLIKEIEEKYRHLQIISRLENKYYKAFQLFHKKDLVLIFNYKNPKTINYINKENYADFTRLVSDKYFRNDSSPEHPDFFEYCDLLPKRNLILIKFVDDGTIMHIKLSNFENEKQYFKQNNYQINKTIHHLSSEEQKYDSVYEARKLPDSAVKPPRTRP